MRTGRSPSIISRRMIVVVIGMLLVLASAIGESFAESIREQVEAEWRIQDQARMAEILKPGLVRFVESELNWPGVAGDNRRRVPRTVTPVLDGRLDDACWEDALRFARGAEHQPEVLLSHDGQRFCVGVALPTSSEAGYRGDPTAADAGGAVNGVKDGVYSFHTNREPSPWWQVDLGSRVAIGKIVVYNRLDYKPGLHNADNLLILTSDDGLTWTPRYDNQGVYFGGATDGKPLVVNAGSLSGGADGDPIKGRFVRLQIASDKPIFFHLDEVEVYGPGDEPKNLALDRPASQSSLSIWSRGLDAKGGLFNLGRIPVRFDAAAPDSVRFGGAILPADRAIVRREKGTTTIELSLPIADIPGGFPSAIAGVAEQPVPLAAGGNWEITWADGQEFGFGANRTTVDLQAKGTLDVPVVLTVESVVFTPRRPERQVVFQRELTKSGPVPIEFQIEHEGAAALIVTAVQGQTAWREGRAFYVQPVAETLDRARRLLIDFQVSPPEELDSLSERAEALAGNEKTTGPDPFARTALFHQARWAARRIAFMNPRIDFDKMVVVKRFTQETYPDVCLNHMPWVSRPGGDICVLSLAGAEAECKVRNVINGALGPGHVHGMDLWWDADRVVFGYSKAKSDQPPAGWLDRRTSYELRRNEEPTHIFEIGVDSTGLKQLTSGEWSDLDPTYLANGDVAFVSERVGCSLQCNELNKDETSCNLYVMRPDGSEIRHMSVTKDGDYLPHALDDGTVVYTRWEYQERSWAHIQSIWTIRPDGTFADSLYKQHMNNPWALEDMRSIPGSKKLVAVATGHHTLAAGPVVIVDPHEGMNDPAGLRIVTPGVVPPEGGMVGTPDDAGGVIGRGGYYMTPWPLSDKHFLVSYAYCKGATGGLASEVDPTGYAIYLIDVHGTKELIYRDPEISCFAPIPLRPRTRPPIVADTTDPSVPHATCMVADAAYGVEGVDPKSARYIRISQRLQWPYSNEFGGERYEPDVKSVMTNWTPARVLGEVPIESDGSAHFLVPTDTPVYFQLLDENHMELRRMRSFISFQPGEARGCVGCHETREEAPAVIDDSFPLAVIREPSIPQPPPWGDVPISYLRDVQPVFDRHCTGCHGGLKPAAKLDFSGGLTANYNRSYDTIGANGLVSRSNVGEDARITQPLEFGSHKSRLVEVLRSGVCSSRAKLTDEDWLRLVTWIDANAPYHDGFINKRQEHPPYDLPGDAELAGAIAAVHARRCADCHSSEEVSRIDWIDINAPEESRFLTAPLAKDAKGAGRCAVPAYKDRNDPDYRAVLQLVETAVGRAWEYPRRDVEGLGSRKAKLAQRVKGP